MLHVFDKLNPLAIIIIVAIVGIFAGALVTTIMVRRKYMSIGEELEKKQNSDGLRYKHEVLNFIIEDYEIAARANVEDVNTQAIIERNFNRELSNLSMGERFVKHAVSLMIVLGLLGTFYGLTLSIGRLVDLLGSSGSEQMLSSMDSVITGLINSVKGMSVAFVTSLFGIASSIVLTIFNVIYDVEGSKEAVMVEMEEYLDNHVAKKYIQKSQNKALEEQALMEKNLQFTVKELGQKLDENFKYIADQMSQQFVSATSDMGNSSKALLESIQLFDKSLKDFKENTRDFSEFNYQLRTNIERMNVGFADFIEDLKGSKNSISIKKDE